ncbi:hypothetical protein PHMEG_0002350 [Phytophthora megakarya]|uniref:Uncharacterized protein n=1 Tax=Phytophthora megakarya TaxID=4795 RepID=A0A225X0T1_9STRA|nr:hypothetical protein PHMEG_0002350 [Phytophthora megakarya]
MKTPSLSTSKATATLWTARFIASLWKLAVKRARQLRRQSQSTDIMYGSDINPTSGQETFELDEASILQEAALSVVASGVVSLADLEAVTGFRLSKTHDKDDDASSDAATDTDSCSIADSDVFENLLDEVASPKETKPINGLYSTTSTKSTPQMSSNSTKSAKWICVGYGRYIKMQQQLC